MITVAILINGQPIMARSATNICEVKAKRGEQPGQWCSYRADDGSHIRHRREDGAVNLAIRLLQTIKETK